uniref:Uncharacterized protein n=1 Tax=Arundo donax TaxID=35708 RepID=A0A0A9FFW1_ARUDO
MQSRHRQGIFKLNLCPNKLSSCLTCYPQDLCHLPLQQRQKELSLPSTRPLLEITKQQGRSKKAAGAKKNA